MIIHLKPAAGIVSKYNPVSLGAPIPVKLFGRAPWILTYKINDIIGIADPYELVLMKTINVPESPHNINASQVGYYSLIGVEDALGQQVHFFFQKKRN